MREGWRGDGKVFGKLGINNVNGTPVSGRSNGNVFSTINGHLSDSVLIEWLFYANFVAYSKVNIFICFFFYQFRTLRFLF